MVKPGHILGDAFVDQRRSRYCMRIGFTCSSRGVGTSRYAFLSFPLFSASHWRDCPSSDLIEFAQALVLRSYRSSPWAPELSSRSRSML